MASHISKTLVPLIVEDEMKSIGNQHLILHFNNRWYLEKLAQSFLFTDSYDCVCFSLRADLFASVEKMLWIYRGSTQSRSMPTDILYIC